MKSDNKEKALNDLQKQLDNIEKNKERLTGSQYVRLKVDIEYKIQAVSRETIIKK